MRCFRPHLRASLLAAVVSSTVLTACANSAAPVVRSAYITAAIDHAPAAVLSGGTIDLKKLYPKFISSTPSKTAKGDTTFEKFSVKPTESPLITFGKNGNVIAIPATGICDDDTGMHPPSLPDRREG